ncbi:hypothetical protein JHW43_004121 [Diplocarpon mali]|nr:hypothetical protein JHW43_004121 [Diplocarpon mali]
MDKRTLATAPAASLFVDGTERWPPSLFMICMLNTYSSMLVASGTLPRFGRQCLSDDRTRGRCLQDRGIAAPLAAQDDADEESSASVEASVAAGRGAGELPVP